MKRLDPLSDEAWGMRAFYGGLAGGVLLALSALILSLITFSGYEEGLKGFDRGLVKALMDGRDEDTKTVVVFGNSRLRNAMSLGDDPSAPVDLGDGRKLRILKFANDFSDFFSYGFLIADVLNEKPDYLILQKPLLSSMGQSQVTLLSSLSEAAYFWIDQKIRGHDAGSYWRENRETIIEDCLSVFRGVDLQDTIRRLSFHYHHDLDENTNINRKLVRAAVQRALDMGAKVIILDVPANVAAEQALGLPAHVLDYNGLGYEPDKKDLLPGLYDRVTWLVYPHQAVSKYCDFIHLNHDGRRDFTDWLVREISALR